ncbi:MAG TPA: DUF3072 domain-containing protein [Rhodopila sp.]|nr:DUF3072 domain-containing protein [Rhodopila sp.]
MSQDNRHHADAAPASNAQKNPNDWITGDETIMGTQTSYLKTPCEEADKSFDPDLTKADASTYCKPIPTAAHALTAAWFVAHSRAVNHSVEVRLYQEHNMYAGRSFPTPG